MGSSSACDCHFRVSQLPSAISICPGVTSSFHLRYHSGFYPWISWLSKLHFQPTFQPSQEFSFHPHGSRPRYTISQDLLALQYYLVGCLSETCMPYYPWNKLLWFFNITKLCSFMTSLWHSTFPHFSVFTLLLVHLIQQCKWRGSVLD